MDKNVLMEFLQKVDKDFTPYLSQKTDLSAFGDRLLNHANLFVSKDEKGKLRAW